MRSVFLLVVVMTAWMAGDHPMSAQQAPGDPCPLKWRKDPVAAAEARAAKKQRMRDNGVPERYLHLLDSMECVWCIETASDTLHITVLYNDDEHAPTLSTGQRDLKREFRWNPQSERQLRDELRSGQIRAFYVWIHEKRCNCCPDEDKPAESYADWDDEVEANMDQVEEYEDPDDLGPLPDDLKPPPPGTQTPPPPIERFDDLPRPTRRVLQATCKPCEGLAQQWTSENSNLNFLWDRKIEQMRRVSVIANARGNRENEIENLEYQQQFDSSRTYDRMQKINELKKINEDQEADQDRAEREIERLDGEIAATEKRMEELMQKFLECEKSCQKTTTADPTGVAATTANELPPAYYAGLPVPTTATLTPSLRLDPVIPGPPSTFVPPKLALNATAGDVAPPNVPAPTVILPIERGAMTTAGVPSANATARSADPQRPTACPPCQVLAEFVQRAANDVATAQATLDNIRANIALLTKAAQGLDPKDPRALSIAGQLQQLAAAQTPAELQLGVLQQVLNALEGQLTACQQKCAEPAGGGQTGTANATGTGGASPKPAPVMAHPDEKLAITDRKLIVSKCTKCDPVAKLLNEAFDRAEAHSRKVSDWHTHHDIVNNEVRRNAEETRRMQQQFERTGEQAFADRVKQLNQQTGKALTEITEAFVQLQLDARVLIAEINGLWAELQACNQTCAETTSNSTNTTGATSTTTASTAGAPGATADRPPDKPVNSTGGTNPTTPVGTTGSAPAPVATTTISRRELDSSSDPFDRAVYQGGTSVSSSTAPMRRSTYADGSVTYTDTQSGTTYTVTPNREGTFDVSYNGATMRVPVQQGGLETAARLLVDLPATTAVNTTESATTTSGSTTTSLTPEQRAAIREILHPYAATTGASETAKTNTALVEGACGSVEDCAKTWGGCIETNSCLPLEQECIFTGTCSNAVSNRSSGPAASDFNLMDSPAWNTSANAEVETRIQIKIGDVIFDVVIRSVQSVSIESWFNPLGLLTRHLRDNMERWHGSVGPRPLPARRDLELVEEHSGSQAAGLPKGVHVLLTDRGGSTGKTLAMQVLNLSGQQVKLSSLPFVIEPLKQQVQQRVQQAFTRLVKAAPVNVELAGYCLEFMKLPPSANQIFRLAPTAVQKKFEAMSRVLRSAHRVQQAGALRPDSNPAAYTDSIKQWALWAVEQKFNEKSFTDAFLGHTKKNVEGAGQQWSKPAEDMVRKVSPNRWRDILKVLQGAGLPVPQ